MTGHMECTHTDRQTDWWTDTAEQHHAIST